MAALVDVTNVGAIAGSSRLPFSSPEKSTKAAALPLANAFSSFDTDLEHISTASESDLTMQTEDGMQVERGAGSRATPQIFFGTPSSLEMQQKEKYQARIRSRKILRRDSIELNRRKSGGWEGATHLQGVKDDEGQVQSIPDGIEEAIWPDLKAADEEDDLPSTPIRREGILLLRQTTTPSDTASSPGLARAGRMSLNARSPIDLQGRVSHASPYKQSPLGVDEDKENIAPLSATASPLRESPRRANAAIISPAKLQVRNRLAAWAESKAKTPQSPEKMEWNAMKASQSLALTEEREKAKHVSIRLEGRRLLDIAVEVPLPDSPVKGELVSPEKRASSQKIVPERTNSLQQSKAQRSSPRRSSPQRYVKEAAPAAISAATPSDSPTKARIASRLPVPLLSAKISKPFKSFGVSKPLPTPPIRPPSSSSIERDKQDAAVEAASLRTIEHQQQRKQQQQQQQKDQPQLQQKQKQQQQRVPSMSTSPFRLSTTRAPFASSPLKQTSLQQKQQQQQHSAGPRITAVRKALAAKHSGFMGSSGGSSSSTGNTFRSNPPPIRRPARAEQGAEQRFVRSVVKPVQPMERRQVSAKPSSNSAVATPPMHTSSSATLARGSRSAALGQHATTVFGRSVGGVARVPSQSSSSAARLRESGSSSDKESSTAGKQFARTNSSTILLKTGQFRAPARIFRNGATSSSPVKKTTIAVPTRDVFDDAESIPVPMSLPPPPPTPISKDEEVIPPALPIKATRSLPLSKTELAKITATNTKSNEKVLTHIEVVVVRKNGELRPASPSGKFRKSAASSGEEKAASNAEARRARAALRAGQASSSDEAKSSSSREDPIEHRIGAGEASVYSSPKDCNGGSKRVHWHKALFAGSSDVCKSGEHLRKASSGPVKAILNGTPILDRFGNIAKGGQPIESLINRRKRIVVTKIIYDDDEEANDL